MMLMVITYGGVGLSYDISWINKIYELELWYLIAIITTTATSIYVWYNSRKSILLQKFLFMLGVLLFWLGFKMLKNIAPDIFLKWTCTLFEYMSLCFFSISVLSFGFVYAKGKKIGFKPYSILLFVMLLIFFTILTNPYHHQFFTEFSLNTVTLGGAFYIYQVGIGLYILGGIIYCVSCFDIQKGNQNICNFLIIIGIVLIPVANVIFSLNLININIDITAIAIIISMIIFLFVAYKYGFLDVIPIGVSRAINNINEDILIYDKKLRLLYRNAHSLEMQPDVFKFLQKKVEENIISIVTNGIDYRDESLNINQFGKSYSMSIKPVLNFSKRTRGYICSIYDNTPLIEAISNLEEKNEQLVEMNDVLKLFSKQQKQLAVIKERNRLAKDIHDVFGHSLNLALNVFESSKVIISSNPSIALKRMKDALYEIDKEMKEIERSQVSKDLLKKLYNLSDKWKAACVKVDIVEDYNLSNLDDFITNPIFRICQEGITNAIKHGNANYICIAIKEKDRILDIVISNNGNQCTNIIKGNGLKGIEERVRDLNGFININSSDKDGFSIHIGIPINSD